MTVFWLKPLLKGKGVRRQFVGTDTPASFLNLDVMLCTEEEWGLVLDGITDRYHLPLDFLLGEKKKFQILATIRFSVVFIQEDSNK